MVRSSRCNTLPLHSPSLSAMAMRLEGMPRSMPCPAAPLLLISPALSTSASIGPGLVAGTQLPSYAPVLSKLHLYMFWQIRVFGAPGSGLGLANELRVELRAISENSPAMMCSWWSQWVALEPGVCRVSHLEGSCWLAAMLFREACCC